MTLAEFFDLLGIHSAATRSGNSGSAGAGRSRRGSPVHARAAIAPKEQQRRVILNSGCGFEPCDLLRMCTVDKHDAGNVSRVMFGVEYSERPTERCSDHDIRTAHIRH